MDGIRGRHGFREMFVLSSFVLGCNWVLGDRWDFYHGFKVDFSGQITQLIITLSTNYQDILIDGRCVCLRFVYIKSTVVDNKTMCVA